MDKEVVLNSCVIDVCASVPVKYCCSLLFISVHIPFFFTLWPLGGKKPGYKPAIKFSQLVLPT